MRIDGGYTFPASSGRVFDALINPDCLKGVIPGCERLIQLGPATAEGAASFEARVRTNSGVVRAHIVLTAVRRPAHARFDLRLYTSAGRLHGRGLFDLVDQGAHTVGAYVLDVSGATPADAVPLAPEGVQAFIQTLCDALACKLRMAAEPVGEVLATHGSPRAIAVTTPLGRIVALAPTLSDVGQDVRAQCWAERMLWVGGGFLMGIGVLALVAGLARRLTSHPDA